MSATLTTTATIEELLRRCRSARASYQADLHLDRSPEEIEYTLAYLARAEGALADALLALYRPDLLAPATTTGASCANCRRALTAEDVAHSGAEGVCGSCTTLGCW